MRSSYNGNGGHNSSTYNGPSGAYTPDKLTGQPLNWVPEIYRDGTWSGVL